MADALKQDPSLLLVLKWGGELTPAGRVQAEELGRAFRCMYPGGQGITLYSRQPKSCPSKLDKNTVYFKNRFTLQAHKHYWSLLVITDYMMKTVVNNI